MAFGSALHLRELVLVLSLGLVEIAMILRKKEKLSVVGFLDWKAWCLMWKMILVC